MEPAVARYQGHKIECSLNEGAVVDTAFVPFD